MEFYFKIFFLQHLIILKFQFPTGWNSTKVPDTFPSEAIGFNSQRDGILPSISNILTFIDTVSIPNGMEFYAIRTGQLELMPKFQFPTGWNSTKELLLDDSRLEFQFPTGWNSTLYLRIFATSSPVSIPNGMEFYLKPPVPSPNNMRFNSQRDGILRCSSATSLCNV